MNKLRRFFLYLWILFSDLPPVSPGRLLMPAVFLAGWTVLRLAGTAAPVAFVWAAVLAQAVQAWGVLPVTVKRQRQQFGRARHATTWAVAAVIGVLAFQVWWGDPWMSQRLVSIYCGLYAAVMAFGVGGDRDVLNRFAYASEEVKVPTDFRRHLLKLYALVAILVVAVNETLLAMNAPLGVRVVTLSLLPVVLHYFFAIALTLTHPPLDERDA